MYYSDKRFYRNALAVTLALVFLSTATLSAQVPLGTSMPGQDIVLTNPDGSSTTLSALKGTDATLVVFWGNRCPWVRKIEDRMADFSTTFGSSTRKVILVNSNDGDAFSAESISSIATASADLPAGVIYVSDPNGELSIALDATRTPEYFLFDDSDALVYTGSLDDSPGDASKVSKTYLADAYGALASSTAIGVGVTKSFGCMIKRKR